MKRLRRMYQALQSRLSTQTDSDEDSKIQCTSNTITATCSTWRSETPKHKTESESNKAARKQSPVSQQESSNTSVLETVTEQTSSRPEVTVETQPISQNIVKKVAAAPIVHKEQVPQTSNKLGLSSLTSMSSKQSLLRKSIPPVLRQPTNVKVIPYKPKSSVNMPTMAKQKQLDLSKMKLSEISGLTMSNNNALHDENNDSSTFCSECMSVSSITSQEPTIEGKPIHQQETSKKDFNIATMANQNNQGWVKQSSKYLKSESPTENNQAKSSSRKNRSVFQTQQQRRAKMRDTESLIMQYMNSSVKGDTSGKKTNSSEHNKWQRAVSTSPESISFSSCSNQSGKLKRHDNKNNYKVISTDRHHIKPVIDTPHKNHHKKGKLNQRKQQYEDSSSCGSDSDVCKTIIKLLEKVRSQEDRDFIREKIESKKNKSKRNKHRPQDIFSSLTLISNEFPYFNKDNDSTEREDNSDPTLKTLTNPDSKINRESLGFIKPCLNHQDIDDEKQKHHYKDSSMENRAMSTSTCQLMLCDKLETVEEIADRSSPANSNSQNESPNLKKIKNMFHDLRKIKHSHDDKQLESNDELSRNQSSNSSRDGKSNKSMKHRYACCNTDMEANEDLQTDNVKSNLNLLREYIDESNLRKQQMMERRSKSINTANDQYTLLPSEKCANNEDEEDVAGIDVTQLKNLLNTHNETSIVKELQKLVQEKEVRCNYNYTTTVQAKHKTPDAKLSSSVSLPAFKSNERIQTQTMTPKGNMNILAMNRRLSSVEHNAIPTSSAAAAVIKNNSATTIDDMKRLLATAIQYNSAEINDKENSSEDMVASELSDIESVWKVFSEYENKRQCNELGDGKLPDTVHQVKTFSSNVVRNNEGHTKEPNNYYLNKTNPLQQDLNNSYQKQRTNTPGQKTNKFEKLINRFQSQNKFNVTNQSKVHPIHVTSTVSEQTPSSRDVPQNMFYHQKPVIPARQEYFNNQNKQESTDLIDYNDVQNITNIIENLIGQLEHKSNKTKPTANDYQKTNFPMFNKKFGYNNPTQIPTSNDYYRPMTIPSQSAIRYQTQHPTNHTRALEIQDDCMENLELVTQNSDGSIRILEENCRKYNISADQVRDLFTMYAAQQQSV